MAWIARAPGKLVILGEYAVLDGAQALVMAVNRYCSARIEASGDDRCHLEIRHATAERFDFEPEEAAPAAMVALIQRRWSGRADLRPWRAQIDSTAFFDGSVKLGLGSSAAVLCAWAGAFGAYLSGAASPPNLGVERLIELHRDFQGGAGSGLDVAASRLGGVLSFRLDPENTPQIGSVRLPNGVRFAGVFTGVSASTPDLVGRYRAWTAAAPEEAAERIRTMGELAAAGHEACVANDRSAFLSVVAQYGERLGELGRAMQAEVVTADHGRILAVAKRFGVIYKVSGAGGGDLGLALTDDPEALAAFSTAAAETGFKTVDLELDNNGLVIEDDD